MKPGPPPVSQPVRVLVHRPTPGRVLLELVAPPAALLAVAEGTVLAGRLQPRIGRVLPLVVSVPAPGAPEDA